MAMDGLKLSVRGVCLAVRRQRILQDITFEVGTGDVVALVGLNGAGKSSLLSVIAGCRSADAGEVSLHINGVRSTSLDFRSKVAFLPHELLIYPDLTAAENLHLTAVLYNSREVDTRVSRALAAVCLRQASRVTARTFSRGMLQRLAVARLMVTGARVWLLDEPMTGLDEPGRHWLKETLGNHKLSGGLVLLSSHVREEVSDCAARVILLESGRIALDGAVSSGAVDEAFGRLETQS